MEVDKSNWFELPCGWQVETHQFISACRTACKPQLSRYKQAPCVNAAACMRVCAGLCWWLKKRDVPDHATTNCKVSTVRLWSSHRVSSCVVTEAI